MVAQRYSEEAARPVQPGVVDATELGCQDARADERRRGYAYPEPRAQGVQHAQFEWCVVSAQELHLAQDGGAFPPDVSEERRIGDVAGRDPVPGREVEAAGRGPDQPAHLLANPAVDNPDDADGADALCAAVRCFEIDRGEGAYGHGGT